eukprot:tig00020528_g9985.t1
MQRRLAAGEAAPPRDSDAEEYEALQELSLRLLEEYDIAAAAAAAAAAPEPPAEPPPGPPPEPEPLSAPPPARASSCSLPAARAARPVGPAGATPPAAKRPRTLADLRAGEQAAVLGVVMQIFPEQAVLCGSEHVSTSNVIVADRSGERLRLTFWRAGAAWAQRLWPGDVLQVFSVALKEWQGQVTGNVGRASDARVLRRLRTGPERAPEPLSTGLQRGPPSTTRPSCGRRRPPRPRPPPRGPVDFAPSLAALQPDTLLHVRPRRACRRPSAGIRPERPPQAAPRDCGRRRYPDRPVCLHLWEEGVARLLPLLCPGTLVELQYLQCRADPHLPAGRPHLHCTPRTAAAPLSPADPAAARLVAAFGPPPFVEYPSLAALPPSGLVRVPALVSFLRLPDDVPWTGDGFGVDDEGYRRRTGPSARPAPAAAAPSSPAPSAEEAVRWEFRPAFALLSDSDPSGGDGAPHPPPLRALLRPAALAASSGTPRASAASPAAPSGPQAPPPRTMRGEGRRRGGWRFPQGRAAYEAASASVAARAAALRGPGVRPALLQLAVRARVDGAGFPLEHSVEVLGAEEGAPAPGPGERTLNA